MVLTWFPDEQDAGFFLQNFAAEISIGEKIDLKK